jgi:hypothetical protein
MMTDAQKVEALTELLKDVMHTLEMKQYEIEDATQSHQCEVEADEYHQKMMDILYNEAYTETFFGTPITQEQVGDFN